MSVSQDLCLYTHFLSNIKSNVKRIAHLYKVICYISIIF